MERLQSYVGGRWVDGGGTPVVLTNPATEEPVAEVRKEPASVQRSGRRDHSGPSVERSPAVHHGVHRSVTKTATGCCPCGFVLARR